MTISLSIAGSDSSGGAGIQADLKTFSALGVYGMSVITALTAQSTQGVDDILAVCPDFVGKQFLSLLNDSHIDSIKIGMLMNKEIVMVVSQLLKKQSNPYIVLDTVMVAKSGHALLQQDAIAAIRHQLLPLATVITPNLPEAAQLLYCEPATNEVQMIEQGRELLALGPNAVLMKGGHLAGSECPDYLITKSNVIRFTAPRIITKNTHGTGCTLSAAITALLPSNTLPIAVNKAKNYLSGALAQADRLSVGKGIGPTHHFYRWW